MAHNQRLGRWGEDAAARWYRSAGYRVLARNWRCTHGEIDLIVALGADVIFAEVKTRSSTRFGTGAEAVDHRKQRRIRASAREWLARSDRHYAELRFDVVDVDGAGHVVVHEGCF